MYGLTIIAEVPPTFKRSLILYQRHAELFALLSHVVWPDAGLDFSDVRFLEQNHAQSALSDATSDAQGEFVVDKLLVEIEFASLLFPGNLELAEQRLFIDADTHRR